MVVADGLGALRRRLHQGDRAAQVTLIGERAGGDDAPLGEHLVRRRHRLDLAPHAVDRRPAAERPVAVGDDRHDRRIGAQIERRLERADRRLELSEPVAGEAVHLVGGGDVGRLLGDRAGEAFRFLEALTVERLGGLGQPLGQPGSALLADAIDELGRDLGIERLRLHGASARTGVPPTPDRRP